MTTPSLGSLLYTFFEDHLKAQKGLRPASVKSYRDALRLFLLFVAKELHCKMTRVATSDLTDTRVLRFLSALEIERHNHIRSRNQRLTALKAFFNYLASQAPELLAQAERVCAIPMKRVPPPQTFFLERDEVEALFAKLPMNGVFALRDRALLLFLYNTGARVQEVADLCVRNLELDRRRVHLHGKGDKWRTCPLWDETVSLLIQLVHKESDASVDRPVFTSQRRQALTRFGIYKIVRHHTRHLTKRSAGLKSKSISPHVFRHSAAVGLLESGVEANVIRAWLGHVSLETTHRYAEITTGMKAAALQACEAPPQIGVASPRTPMWRDDPSLLKWLESL
jgi:site-specific recombinase XerD